LSIVVEGLRKSYRDVEALRGVDLRVQDGELVAILGPNGAGKTTLVEILEGFRHRDAGIVEVLGQDPATADRSFRGQVGIVLQECEAEPFLSVTEMLALHAGYHDDPRDIDELLELVELTRKSDSRVRTLSGGQRRRLDLALALVGRPSLLFLDEPTTGFDPQARRNAWDLVRRLRTETTTIVLTTHYLDEAEALADRVVVISRGKVVADTTPAALGGRDRAAAVISFRPLPDTVAADLPVPVIVADRRWLVDCFDTTRALAQLTGWAVTNGIELVDLRVSRPSLEDTYLELIA
jgi:ABC-2 type transport system ATP-binding protein